MRFLVLLSVTAMTLAGCSSNTHEMDAYLMLESDAPDACYYIDPEDDDWKEYAQIGGFEQNPGSVNNFYLTVDNVRPMENRFAVFECKFDDGYYQYASGVWRFASAEDAQQWMDAVQEGGSAFSNGARCVPQALVFTDGATVGAIATFSSTWHPAFEAAAQERFAEILHDEGAAGYCS